MKKFLAAVIILLTMFPVLSCYDDSGEDCEDAPSSCISSEPSTGALDFNVTIDADNPSVVIHLREGSDYDSGINEQLINTSNPYYSLSSVTNGDYSAMVSYTVNYNGKTYMVEAVDGVDLSYTSDTYCGGITCYEEGSETLELEFDREAFIAKLEGTGKECFIATAVYGSGSAWQVDYLRSFRDRVLNRYSVGRYFIKQYYAHSPEAASFISKRPVLKQPVRGILSAIILVIMHPGLSLMIMIFLPGAVFFSVRGCKALRRKEFSRFE